MSTPEHSFADDVLVSGENIDSYTAGADLTKRTPVGLSADYEVTEPSKGSPPFQGVVAYDVSKNEEVAVIKRDCEVRVKVSESVSAGDALTPDGSGGFEVATSADSDIEVAVANEGGGASSLIVAEITSGFGNTN
jgi:hypothetical protein